MDAADATKTLISEIIDIEQEMFESVKALGPSECQERPKTFRLMRWMSHSVLSKEILFSYLDDLRAARREGRNFMTEKYARMAEQIPPLYKDTAVIEGIVTIEIGWMEEMHVAHARIFPGTGESFRVYISCELETLSPRTLELMHAFVAEAAAMGRNLVRERYTNLFGRLGYASIEAYAAQQGK